MKKQIKYAIVQAALGILITSGLTSCSSVVTHTELQEVDAGELGLENADGSTFSRQAATGVYPFVWEEPMIDVVDVPPGLDPEGHYYRPAHQMIMEIRQGRWQYYDRSKGGDGN